MRKLLLRLLTFCREDPGQDLVEYTLLIAFLAMAAAGVLTQAGVSVQGPWSSANTTLAAANGSGTSTATAPPSDGGGDHCDHGDHDGH